MRARNAKSSLKKVNKKPASTQKCKQQLPGAGLLKPSGKAEAETGRISRSPLLMSFFGGILMTPPQTDRGALPEQPRAAAERLFGWEKRVFLLSTAACQTTPPLNESQKEDR